MGCRLRKIHGNKTLPKWLMSQKNRTYFKRKNSQTKSHLKYSSRATHRLLDCKNRIKIAKVMQKMKKMHFFDFFAIFTYKIDLEGLKYT